MFFADAHAEYVHCDKFRTAGGGRTDVTYVILDPKAPEKVLIEGSKGPVKTKAKFIHTGLAAPRRVSLDPAMVDDEPLPAKPAGIVGATITHFRITVAKEFAGDALFDRLHEEPEATGSEAGRLSPGKHDGR